MRLRVWTLVAVLLFVAPTAVMRGQSRPPVVGTISEQAGRVAGPPTPASGMTHVPTRRPPPTGITWTAPGALGAGGWGATASGVNSLRASPISTIPLGSAVHVPLLVRDAPAYNRGGSTLGIVPLSTPVVSEPRFYPTADAPVWRIVPEAHPVQGWRLVDVDDVICYPATGCEAVTTRVIARWIPSLRRYGFRDRLGRLWQVE